MKQRYDYFQYKLPDKPASYYIDRAVPVLRELRERFPKQYEEIFCCASEVLTISGVRALDTYYVFDYAPTELVNEIALFLKSKQLLVAPETFPYADTPNTEQAFSLVHLQAIHEIPDRYGYVPAWQPFHGDKIQQPQDFFLWWSLWKERVVYLPDNATHKDPIPAPIKQWMQHDAYAAHNMTFGMLLGYPGEAICSTLWESERDRDEGLIVDARIAEARRHDGAIPVYSYHKELASSKTIQAHEKLWSDILSGVYAQLEG